MEEARNLILRARTTCLWFIREDYSPSRDTEVISLLDKIQRYGNRETYMQARELKEWLLRNSSARSSP